MLFNPLWNKPEYANPDAVGTLTAARALIDTPDKWCHEGSGFADGGKKRCVLMAAWTVIGFSNERGQIRPGSIELLALAIGKGNLIENNSEIADWNDTSTHDTVMCAMDQAIELAKWVPADVA